ncbi:MAG: xanthine dehydrogenase family protein [Spirochaetales bacterium]|nr:xanthine dehydrogenase family protein [Spirochaetales bacterium]
MPEAYKDKRFITDYYSAGMTVIKILRAPVQRGTITSVYIPNLPEGTGVIQYKDIPAEKEISVFENKIPLLCDGNIRYEGEPILLLYGKDERELQILESEIKIEYETDYTILSLENYSQEQINKELNFSRGNIDKAIDKAETILEQQFTTSRQNNYDIDPQGAAAFYSKKKFEIVCATQWPFNVRDNIAECLDIPKKQISVNVPSMGKNHGGKLWYAAIIACYTAIVTSITKKPSICLIPKTDAILFTPGRAASIINHKTALDNEGKILSREIEILFNSGAYPILTDEILNRICFSAAGVYSTQILRITVKSIKTNAPPCGSLTGMGFYQSFFAGEMHCNSLAEAAEIGPLEWRLQNLATKQINLPFGWESKRPMQLKTLLTTVADKSDFRRKYSSYKLTAKKQNNLYGKKRGIGLALCCQGNGFTGKVEQNGRYSVSVRLEMDGSLIIYTSAIPDNMHTAELWCNLAGNILEIDSENVRIETADTELVPDSGPSLYSRNITVITQLIERCCNAIKKSRFRRPLPIEIKRTYRTPATTGWEPESFNCKPFSTISWGAVAVETETDPITLMTDIRGIWFAADCGKIINEETAKAEVENEIYRSVMNSMVKPPVFSYLKQNIPLTPVKSSIFFPVDIEFIKSRETKPGGIGELPDSLIPAALSEAISMALNTEIKNLPSNPKSLFRQIEHRKKVEAENNED